VRWSAGVVWRGDWGRATAWSAYYRPAVWHWAPRHWISSWGSMFWLTYRVRYRTFRQVEFFVGDYIILGGWTRWVRRGLGRRRRRRGWQRRTDAKWARPGGSGTLRSLLLRPCGSLVHTSGLLAAPSRSRSGMGRNIGDVLSSDWCRSSSVRHRLLAGPRRVWDFRRVLHKRIYSIIKGYISDRRHKRVKQWINYIFDPLDWMSLIGQGSLYL